MKLEILNTILHSDNQNNHIIKTIDFNNDFGIIKLLKYNKNSLRSEDDFESFGLLRSMIFFNDKLKGVSPGKSMEFNEFIGKYDVTECTAEEFIEGTMINLCYIEETNKWQISTRSNIGANNIYFTKGKFKSENTFANMFEDACIECNIQFDKLPKKYCYSFVLQHPNNRIVKPIIDKRIYLIAAYEVKDNFEVENIDIAVELSNIILENNMRIDYPKKINFQTFEELTQIVENENNYENVGIMIHDKNRTIRTKIRNKLYEKVRRLRGNQPKLEYHFLELNKTGCIEEYLKYFKEDEVEFSKYEKKVDEFSNNLIKQYVDCFIKKTQHLKEFPFEFKGHLYELHENYKKTKKKICKTVVNNYIKSIQPAKLMHSINYKYR